MPGASKKRGKLDRQAARGAGQGPAPGAAAPAPPPPAQPEPVAYDGPGDNRGGPASNNPQPGRAAGPPPNAPAQAEDSPSEASSRPKVDPAKEPTFILNRNVDFPGNAYNLVNQVSSRC